MLISAARALLAPFIRLAVPFLRLVVRGLPFLYGEVLRHTPKHTALSYWLLDFASVIAHDWGSAMRTEWYRKYLGGLGADPAILPNVRIVNTEKVEIGDRVAISHFTMIVAFAPIAIGDRR